MLRFLVVTFGASFLLSGCCGDAPREALATAPDRECQTGVEFGYDVSVWECTGDEHVVAWRESSAFLGCSSTTVERVACGETTPFERSLSEADRVACFGTAAGDGGS